MACKKGLVQCCRAAVCSLPALSLGQLLSPDKLPHSYLTGQKKNAPPLFLKALRCRERHKSAKGTKGTLWDTELVRALCHTLSLGHQQHWRSNQKKRNHTRIRAELFPFCILLRLCSVSLRHVAVKHQPVQHQSLNHLFANLSVGFQHWVEHLQPCYQLPNRHFISDTTVPLKYKEVFEW